MKQKFNDIFYLCINYNDNEDIEIARYGLIHLTVDVQKSIQKAISFLVKEPDFFTVTLRDTRFIGFDLQDCNKRQEKFVTSKLDRDGKNEDYVEITKEEIDMFKEINDRIDFGFLTVNAKEIKDKLYTSFYCYGYTDSMISIRVESAAISLKE